MPNQTVTKNQKVFTPTHATETDLQHFFQQGRRLWEQGEVEAARGMFRQALRCDPEHVPSYQWLGAVLRERGELREAVRMWRTAETLDPHNPQCFST